MEWRRKKEKTGSVSDTHELRIRIRIPVRLGINWVRIQLKLKIFFSLI